MPHFCPKLLILSIMLYSVNYDSDRYAFVNNSPVPWVVCGISIKVLSVCQILFSQLSFHNVRELMVNCG